MKIMIKKRNIKKYFILLAMLVTLTRISAQQLPQYTQYMLNAFPMNPAIAGSGKGYWDCRMSNRNQWTGITDAPRTNILSMHGPSRNQKMGFGAVVFSDIVGPTRRIGFQMAYSYHLKLNDTYTLNLGLSAGVLQYSVDGHKLYLHDVDDPVIPIVYKSALVPDFGAGLYLHSDKLYVSLSVPQFYDAQVKFTDMTHSNLSRIQPHIYAMVGYKFDINDDLQLEPTVLVKYVSPAPVKIDGGLKLTYQQKVWLGANYRTNDAVSAMIGYTHNNWLSIGYSYDITTTRLQKYSSGTHELMLGLKFSKPKGSYKDEPE